jgi:hypothetical protein
MPASPRGNAGKVWRASGSRPSVVVTVFPELQPAPLTFACSLFNRTFPLHPAPSRAIHRRNQPWLTLAIQPLASRAKGNPMKANARHVPSSTPSRGTSLSERATPARRIPNPSEKSVQNPYKSDRFHKAQFVNYWRSTTYAFNGLKCTDFPAVERFPLPREEGQGDGQTGSSFSVSPRLSICPSADLPFRAFASLRLCVQSSAATKSPILDKMRLVETETECHHGVFRMNRKTFLRLVSFCPVLARGRFAAIQNPKWTVLGSKLNKTE